MLVLRILALSICYVFVLLPKSSKQEKMADYVKGKQYWSASFIHEGGTCAACPPNWRSCYNEPINDQERCVVSCRRRAKPKPNPKEPSTSTKLPVTPTATATYIPSELRTEILNPTPSIPAVPVYSSGLHPHETEDEDQPPSGENHGHGMKLGPIIAVSALSAFAFLAIVTLVLFLVRKIQKKSAGERGRVHRRDIEERMALHEIQRPNDGERVHEPANDGVERLHEPANDGVERLHEPANDGVERLHEPNDGEEHLQHREERSQANDAEECVAPQETQLPVQATPSDIQIGGIQDTESAGEGSCSSMTSCLYLTEAEN
ncbi:Hypothetical predicted protein [Paramuricea clavata]|uniref:Uncharacterized protein n=1 Tax=Paramuricea clavata TaxID=317549 RepID=A0A6S7KT08_PARCT|nr:Hypothetical predicted protein [Paramuricea clavata]